MFTSKRQRQRRGIILLVALGLLALFGILIAAYLTFASDSRRAAFNNARRDFRNRNPEALMHEAMMQMIRGTTDHQSAAFRQDLLGDYYGYNSPVIGEVAVENELIPVRAGIASPLPARNVLSIGANTVKVPVRFDIQQPAAAPPVTGPIPPGYAPDANVYNTGLHSSPFNIDDALAGRTVTFLEGPLAGYTLPIVRWMGFRTNDASAPLVHRQQFESRYSMFLYFDLEQLPKTIALEFPTPTVASLSSLISGAEPTLAQSLFYRAANQPYLMIINPIPLNGTGTGIRRADGESQTLNTSTSAVTFVPANGAQTVPLALQPNTTRWWSPTAVPQIFGNADEPYDAPDYENWFLSHTERTVSGGNTRIIPSFHRPAVINYLQALVPSRSNDDVQFLNAVEIVRRATFRPIPEFSPTNAVGTHSRFTGGHPSFVLSTPNRFASTTDNQRFNLLLDTLINGPWDVDNDGDGIPDSVWIDLQLPLQTGPDGALLRPMVAVQIEDLSAKFNVNAHGNVAQLLPDYLRLIQQPLAGHLVPLPGSGGVSLPSGRGYGPAEIHPVLSANGNIVDPTVLSNLFSARYSGATSTETLPGAVLDAREPQDRRLRPNRAPEHERFSTYQIPGDTDANGNLITYGRGGFPVDIFGRGGLGLDPSGNLFSSFAGSLVSVNPIINEAINHPYEFDPTGRLKGDSPYRLSELDVVLNAGRWDANLHAVRLKSTLDTLLASDPSIAKIVTTYSTSEVRPPAAIVPELRANLAARTEGSVAPLGATPPTLVESLMGRILAITGSPLRGNLTATDLQLVDALLAHEIKLGKRIDINRPLGNGLDDNYNGVVDEPAETVSETRFGDTTSIAGAPAFTLYAPPIAFGNATIPETPGQALARNLYCTTVMLMSSEDAAINRWVSNTFPANPPTLRREFVLHRIAQWAVNVVDYRDGDGIMTRFVYDTNLSDGWNPNFTTNPAQTREVWGCEHPELLFSESYAAHDLRVKDTTLDSTGQTKEEMDQDPDVDQIRIPQGSAILELLSPRPRTVSTVNSGVQSFEAVPSELYRNVNSVPFLDLARQAPAGAGLPAVPVWRIAISEPHLLSDNTEVNSPFQYRRANGLNETASFDPAAPVEMPNMPNAPDPLELERFVVFANYADRAAVQTLADRYAVAAGGNAGDINASAIFTDLTFATTGVQPLLPVGSYLTIAPRTVTHLGTLTHTGNPIGLSPQRFEFVANEGLIHYDRSNTRTSPLVYPADNNGDTLQPLVFLAQAFPPPSWGNLNGNNLLELFGAGNLGIGFNISEPVNGATYYRLPENYLLGNAGVFPRRDAYYDYNQGEGTRNGNPDPHIDNSPYDLDSSFPVGRLTDELVGAGSDDPFIGTVNNYRTAFLQRLADPTLPFQPIATQPNYNPYRTVDWIPMDLTVFSGDEQEDKVNSSSTYTNETRRRNGHDRSGAIPQNLLYSNRVNDPPVGPLGAVAAGQPYFSLDVDASIGSLNPEFGPRNTLADAGNIPEYIGQPRNTVLAMHPWLNRPFASPYELMFVPACSQGRLLEEFGELNNQNAYEGTAATDNLATNPTFGHLLNFFDSPEDASRGSHLYRVFDYVSTGPKFRGDALPLSPLTNSVMTLDPSPPNGSLGERALIAQDFWRQAFAFPNNYLPNFTEHGRINLNTVGDQRVYAGLMWSHLPADSRVRLGETEWGEFLLNRRGYTPGGANNLDATGRLNPRFPTEFRIPFTDGMGSYTGIELDGLTPADRNRMQRRWIDGTAARPRVNSDGVPMPNESLYRREPTDMQEEQNLRRSALLRNQRITRMPNLVTANSNSYLIRLTMGYFEVEPVNFNLGREYLSEFGRNERYRATYVVDRSIPCHYVTGADNDTEKVILYRRYEKE